MVLQRYYTIVRCIQIQFCFIFFSNFSNNDTEDAQEGKIKDPRTEMMKDRQTAKDQGSPDSKDPGPQQKTSEIAPEAPAGGTRSTLIAGDHTPVCQAPYRVRRRPLTARSRPRLVPPADCTSRFWVAINHQPGLGCVWVGES